MIPANYFAIVTPAKYYQTCLAATIKLGFVCQMAKSWGMELFWRKDNFSGSHYIPWSTPFPVAQIPIYKADIHHFCTPVAYVFWVFRQLRVASPERRWQQFILQSQTTQWQTQRKPILNFIPQPPRNSDTPRWHPPVSSNVAGKTINSMADVWKLSGNGTIVLHCWTRLGPMYHQQHNV